MAKKKRRRSRRPVAPPVHSAPGTVHTPTPSTEPPPPRPFTPDPPSTGGEHTTHPPAGVTQRPRQPARRSSRRKRGGRTRTYLIIVGIVVLIAGAFFARQTFNNRRTGQLNEIARAAGCGEVTTTSDSGSGRHLTEDQTVEYDTSPPTHGAHDPIPLRAGIYEEPFTNVKGEKPTIYKAVHSLEHGYIIVWHEGLRSADERLLERRYSDAKKVIVVPYPPLKGDDKVVLTAWGRIVRCPKLDVKVVDGFIDLYREARSAPEPRAA